MTGGGSLRLALSGRVSREARQGPPLSAGCLDHAAAPRRSTGDPARARARAIERPGGRALGMTKGRGLAEGRAGWLRADVARTGRRKGGGGGGRRYRISAWPAGSFTKAFPTQAAWPPRAEGCQAAESEAENGGTRRGEAALREPALRVCVPSS